jgi:outer membrane receptor for ferrienterochelin and colicin
MAGQTYAQTAPSDTSQSSPVEEVTVSGTRIVRDGYKAPTPVSVLSYGGNTSGSNSLNFRGLQPTRTLVLPDGKRLVGGNFSGFNNDAGAVTSTSFPTTSLSASTWSPGARRLFTARTLWRAP